MKQFIKDWILPPKVAQKVLKFKNKFQKNSDKLVFENDLKGIEKGKRCFIVGTGSSIKEQNLKLLKDEIVIGVSGLFNHKDIDILNPKYYINPPIFQSHSSYNSEEEFIAYLSDMDNKLKNTTIMFFHIGDKKYIEKYNLFSKKKIIWKEYEKWDEEDIIDLSLNSMPSIWSVSESAIQIALYLGYDEIYLLGFDHDWFNGLFKYAVDVSVARKHFKKSEEDIKKSHYIDSEFQMIRHAKIFAKYKKLYNLKKNIYNANANHNTYVDTFPLVDYNEVLNR